LIQAHIQASMAQLAITSSSDAARAMRSASLCPIESLRLATMKTRLSLIAILLTAAGCGAPPKMPDAVSDAARASGVRTAVAFRSDARELDVRDGEDAAADAVLTIERAVRRAVENSPDVQAALARVRFAHADAYQARLLPNPIIEVAFRVPEAGVGSIVEAGLSADIVALLRRRGRVRAADHRLRAASAQVVEAVLDVIQEVHEAYIATQAAEELVPVQEQRRKLLSRLLNLSRDRLEAGFGTNYEATALEAQLTELSLETAEQETERREQRLRFARLLGQPTHDPSWRLSAWQQPAAPAASEADLIASAQRHRPEIQARQWELAALGEDLSQATLAAWESGSAGVSVEREGSSWSLGPAVSFPLAIFDWGQARRRAAAARRIEARHHLLSERRRAAEEVRRSYAAFAGALQNVARVRNELLPLAQRRQEQAEQAYRAGQVSFSALVLAEQELQEVRMRLIEMQRRTSSALVRLERSVGGAGVMPPRPGQSTAPSGENGNRAAPPTHPTTTQRME
jgi:outer membrane protein TolC